MSTWDFNAIGPSDDDTNVIADRHERTKWQEFACFVHKTLPSHKVNHQWFSVSSVARSDRDGPF